MEPTGCRKGCQQEGYQQEEKLLHEQWPCHQFHRRWYHSVHQHLHGLQLRQQRQGNQALRVVPTQRDRVDRVDVCRCRHRQRRKDQLDGSGQGLHRLVWDSQLPRSGEHDARARHAWCRRRHQHDVPLPILATREGLGQEPQGACSLGSGHVDVPPLHTMVTSLVIIAMGATIFQSEFGGIDGLRSA